MNTACALCGKRQGKYAIEVIRLVNEEKGIHSSKEKKIIVVCRVCNSLIFKGKK